MPKISREARQAWRDFLKEHFPGFVTAAVLVHPDDSIEAQTPANGESFTLDELQAFVGGFIELVYLKECLLVCNEEGKLHNFAYNQRATCIAKNGLRSGDILVGSILFCRPDMVE